MFYTGYPELERTYPRAIIVEKPASAAVLLAAMVELIARHYLIGPVSIATATDTLPTPLGGADVS
jgi:hypothetical protein